MPDPSPEQLGKALNDAAADAKGKPRPAFGTIPCPVCGGILRYRIRTGRDFVIACQTPNCITARG